ncbi:phage specificity protein [Limosilactobacillus reuteri]|uniref:phage specificity protein n=1 Tax=Limosilactobacillus reuteri TaxID=1598 RepID=UPI001E40DFE7|nr:phage specificity protein [Limosilactobacillus reuteri]MCC4427801.1 phage specificity protein [Limosilactobacillus reuteri]MCC4431674.1 phage specificity protein [Limosilactobacillus reuteri]
MEKTIKYLENGEYHYATVRSVGDLAQLKTDSKETLVEAINELWNGGGNADPSKAPKPEGYDQLVEDVADAVKNQQEISQQWIEWQKEDAQLTEERKQAYLQAMKEMQESIDKAKADAAALDDKTAKLDEQITKTFSDLDTSIQNMHEQLQKEADRMNQDLINTKSDLTKVRTDLQNAQLDNGKIHDELTNINGKFEHKVWQTDLDPLKAQIDRAETSVQQTKDELLGKASREDLDTVTNAVSKLDTQLKETAKGVEISVKKDELGGEIAEALTNKTNILLGTRRFTTNNWQQRDHVEICSDPWKGFLVAKQNSPIEGIQQAYDVKAGTTYTFSLFAKMDTLDDSNKPQIILAKTNLDTSLDTKIDVWRKEIEDITSNFKRCDLTFTPSEDCTIYPHVISNSNNPIFVCGYQLEIGKTSTPWEPNQEDVGDYVEKSEAQFNVYNDKIQALTEKQRQQGDTQEKLRTEVTQTAEGTRQVSEKLKKTNDDITELRGEFEVKADHMKSEYETYTNKAVGQISDSTLNLIRNSSFQNEDEDFAQWQNVSAKANVRQDENGLRWVELTQSGMTTDNPQGITSNYFNVKQGKVTVAVDIKSGDKASLDNDSVLSLELYNDVKKRVDFYDVSLSQLGLSKELLGDHKVHRGLYRLGIDRNDAKYMTVKAKLVKNGDLYFTNFSARLSSIDDGAYEPNPDDINQQILKQNTKIEQNAKEVAIKANSVDVTRDIKSAVDNVQVGGTNLANKTNQGTINWMCDPGNGTTNLTEININGNRGVRFNNTNKTTSWWVVKYALDLNKFEPTTDYVISFDIRTPMNVELYGSMFDIAGGDSLNGYFTDTSIHGVIPANKLTHICVSKHTKDHYQSFYLNSWNLSRCDWVDFVNFKIEKGNKGTAWSSAPQDTSDEIKSAKDAAIKVASDQVNIRVNELSTSFDDKLNKRVNEVKTASEKFTSDGIEQTVTKITNVKNDVDRLGDAVSGVNGGSNLLKRTSLDESSGKAYAICYYEIPGGLGPGTYTLSGWARVDQQSLDHKQFIFIDPFTDDWSWSCMMTIPAGLDYQYNKMTFVVPDGTKPVKTVGVYLAHPDNGTNENNNDAISGIGYFKKIKLEKGNNATVWTPHDSEQVTKSRVSGGGINLLKLSSFRNTTIDQLKSAWYVNPDAWINQNNSIVLNNREGKHAIMDLTQTVKLEPDTDYVLSLHMIYGVSNPGQNWGGQTYLVEHDANGNNVNPYKDNYAVIANDAQRSANTRIIHTSPNTHEGIVFLRAMPGTHIEFNDVKLEKGQIGTPWSNAPDDVSTKQEVTASVKNLGDRVTTQVNSVETRVINVNDKLNNLSVGGRNLLLDTDLMSSQYWTGNSQPAYYRDRRALGKYNASLDTSSSSYISFNYKPKIIFDTSKEYTFSAYVCSLQKGQSLSLWLNPDNTYKNSFQNATITNTSGDTDWQRLSVTFTPKRPEVYLSFGASNITTGQTVWVSSLMLEEGNIATDYTHAPEDTIEAIKEVNTKWDVANGQIQGKVTATDVNNILNGKGYATQSWAQTMFQMKSDSITLQAVRDNITNGIQNQVNSINNRVTNAQIGERNLAVGTNRGKAGWWVDPGNGASSTDVALLNGVKGLHINNTKKSTSWWVVCYPFDMGKLKPNTYYTISFDIQTSENTNGGAIIDLARGDSSGSPFIEGRGGNITTRGGEITHITRTLKTGGNIENNGQALYINSIAFGSSNVVNIANLMIVEGTQSSVWKPAPEDQGSGQNLLRGTADFSWPTGIGMNNRFEFNYERFDDSTIAMHLWNIQDGIAGIYTKWGGAFPDGQIQVGEQYTFSFDIKGSGKFATVHNESEPEKPPITLNGVNVPSEWARVSVTGTIQALDKAFIIYFVQGANVWIKNVKIERGAIATPWTPHPFDDKDKGVNLLKSTAYWNPNDWNHISNNVWYDDGWVDSKGHKAYGHHTAWQGLGQTVWVPQGVYTWSAQIYLGGLDSNDSVYPYMGDNQYNGSAQVQEIRRPGLGVNDQNRWIDYSCTFYVKQAGNLCVRPELNRDHGNIHVGSQKLEHGMVATPWTPSPYDSDPKSVVSAINITPDNIKIASNKIVIDGNTDIHGDLRTDRVRLVGKNGAIDMTGDTGIKLTNNDGSSMLLGRSNIDLMYKNDFRMNIDSSLMTIYHRNSFINQQNPIAILNIGSAINKENKKYRGASIRYNPGNLDNDQLSGADTLTIGYNSSIGNITTQLGFGSRDLKLSNGTYNVRKGVNLYDDLTVQPYQRINVGYVDQESDGKFSNDPLMIHRMQWSNSYQADRYQPTIRLGYSKDSMGHAGVTFLWDQVKPFGDRDISDLGSIWFNGQRFVFGWASHKRMFGNQQQPAFMRLDDKGEIMSGIAFTPGSTWDLGSGAWNITASVMNNGG